MGIFNCAAGIAERIWEYFSEKKDQAYNIAGIMGSGIFSYHLLVSSANAELVIKYMIGLVMAGLGGMVTKAGATFWDDILKHKVNKIFKNDKRDEEKRA